MTSAVVFTKDVRSRWVEALRSGRYVQGKYELCTWDGRYCCLGVLADVLGILDVLKGESDIPNCLVDLPTSDRMDLVAMNDRKGYSFENIADYIENNVPYVETTSCLST